VGLSTTLGKYKWLGALPFGDAPTNRPGAGGCCASSVSVKECETGTTLDKVDACSYNAGGCCGQASKNNTDDVAFFGQIVEWFAEHTCADRDMVCYHALGEGGRQGGSVCANVWVLRVIT